MHLLQAVLCMVCLPIICESVITIEDNGYKGLTVAIHESVEEDPKIIENIQELFRSASKSLYQATRKRTYFKEITIVVPDKWTNRNDYEVVQGGNRFSSADIRVDQKNPVHGDDPYTLQTGGCGDQGQYIHMTPAFILASSNESSQYGDSGKTMIHEWSHFRYGVFDEYGVQNDHATPSFYRDGDSNIKPTGCTDDVQGWLRDLASGQACLLTPEGLPDHNCIFVPDLADSASTASIMNMHYLPSVDGYCDNTKEREHNALAPNKHNIMCSGKSTWEVVSSHEDFKDGRNPPREVRDTRPRFRLIQPKASSSPIIILVLDTSASMRGKRMELLHAAASRFLQYQLLDRSRLAMVAFSTDSKILVNLTQVSEHTRPTLLSRVPAKDDEGFTAIGKGLRTALDILRNNREPTEGATIVLVSDGEENVEPYLSQLRDEIARAKVVINTVAFGRHASGKLEDLVKMTGGRGYFYDDEKGGHQGQQALDIAFLESAATLADVEVQPIEVTSRWAEITEGESHKGEFLLDQDIGRNLQIQVTYGYVTKNVELIVTSPTGVIYDMSSIEVRHDPQLRTITLRLLLAEEGTWRYKVDNNDIGKQEVTVFVSSDARDTKTVPIRVRSWVGDVDYKFPAEAKVYAEVKKGYSPVVEASVVATVYKPSGEPSMVMLYDNGAGADTMQSDGVYSGYFTQFNGSGRYSVEVSVMNNGKAKMMMGGGRGSGALKIPVISQTEAKEMYGIPKNTFTDADFQTNVTSQVEDERIEEGDPVVHFERSAAAGAFKLQGFREGDFIPPNRVTDLKVSETDLKECRVTVQWTAAGDDMDAGIASKNDLRYSTNAWTVFNEFDSSYLVNDSSLVSGSLKPLPGQELQSAEIQLPVEMCENVTHPVVFFALRSYDEVGNAAAMSNIAHGYIRIKPESVDSNKDILFYIIIAAAVLVLVAVTLAVIHYCRQSRKREKYDCKQTGQALINK